jgi:hypothetical protein
MGTDPSSGEIEEGSAGECGAGAAAFDGGEASPAASDIAARRAHLEEMSYIQMAAAIDVELGDMGGDPFGLKRRAQRFLSMKLARAAFKVIPNFALALNSWRPITDADVGKTMLVTNNIKARSAHGEMSHRWITWIQEASDPESTGKYVGYDCGNRLIHNLTHCAAIPEVKP